MTKTCSQNFKESAIFFAEIYLLPFAYFVMAAFVRLTLLGMGIVLLYIGCTTFSADVTHASESLPVWERVIIHGFSLISGLGVGSALVFKMLTSSNENLTEW